MHEFQVGDVVDYRHADRLHRTKIVQMDAWVGTAKVTFYNGAEQFWVPVSDLVFVREGKAKGKRGTVGAEG